MTQWPAGADPEADPQTNPAHTVVDLAEFASSTSDSASSTEDEHDDDVDFDHYPATDGGRLDDTGAVAVRAGHDDECLVEG